MNLRLVLIVLFALGAFLCSIEGVQNGRKIYIGWCTFFILLSVSLKSAMYGLQNGGGADTLVYIQGFKGILDMPFSDVWQRLLDRYIYRTGSEEDVGYTLLQWIIAQFTDSYHVFSTIADLFFFIPFAKIIYKYCDTITEIFFAFLAYLALFHTYAMFGARQFYAMGFGLMFFLMYSEKKYKSAILTLLLGMTLHMSLMLVLIPFAISFCPWKVQRNLHVAALFSIPMVWIFANPIIVFMGDFIGNEQYAGYGKGEMMGGATTYILLSTGLSILCLALTNKRWFADENFKYIYAMAPVFTFFTPLVASNGSMMRITAYSQIFITVLVPYLIKARYRGNAKSYLVVTILALSFLILKGQYPPYEFFWNADPQDLW